MTDNPYGISRLPYPINRRTLLEQDDTSVFVSGNPSESNDCSWYVVQLTTEQRLKFTSALLAGLDLIYPNEFVSLFQLWLQPTEFPNSFPPNSIGCDSLDLCDLILECIETTPSLQQAISFYSNSSAITQVTQENPAILATDLMGNQGPCDNDNIFGMCKQLADFLNVTSEDILQLFVAAFSIPGRLGDIIEAIPGIGVLPYDDILQLVEKFAVQINDAYTAAYDTQINEDIACLFFCVAQSDCELTLEDARNAIKTKFLVSVSDTDFLTVINDIIANNWIGEQSIYLIHWFILDTIIFGGEVLGQDVTRMVATIATYFNDPNSDWEILCDECPLFIERLSGDGNANMIPVEIAGVTTTYLTELDLYRGGYDGPGTICRLAVEYTFDSPTLVNNTSWLINAHRTRSGTANAVILYYDGVQKQSVNIPVTSEPQDYVVSYLVPETVTTIFILLGIFVQAPNNGGADLLRVDIEVA